MLMLKLAWRLCSCFKKVQNLACTLNIMREFGFKLSFLSVIFRV